MIKSLLILTLLTVLTGCTSLRDKYIIYSIYANKSVEQIEVKEKQAHPYFNDSGTLNWFTDESYEKALSLKKPVIIECGRKECGNCKVFVERILPKLKDRLGEYVGVASNCDAPNPTIQKLVEKYASKATLLPIVLVFNGSNEFVGAVYGRITEAEFSALIK